MSVVPLSGLRCPSALRSPPTRQRTEFDLDDGLKVNSLKVHDVLAPISERAAKEV